MTCRQGPVLSLGALPLQWLLPISTSLCFRAFSEVLAGHLYPQRPSASILGNAPAPPPSLPRCPSAVLCLSQINYLGSNPCLGLSLGEAQLTQVSYLTSLCLQSLSCKTGETTVRSSWGYGDGLERWPVPVTYQALSGC